MAEGRGEIAGYEFGARSVVRSPLGIEDLDLLKQTVLFGKEDEEYLRIAGGVLEDQVEDVLDVWYGFVGDHPHLIRYFSDAEGQDRKSTRLNSSHEWISYAVFCLKKKKNEGIPAYYPQFGVEQASALGFISPHPNLPADSFMLNRFLGYSPDLAGRFFFFNDTATTEIYTLSLHDALPIWRGGAARVRDRVGDREELGRDGGRDRKSTRLNSSHEWISYAVFCLKKKKKKTRAYPPTKLRNNSKNTNK